MSRSVARQVRPCVEQFEDMNPPGNIGPMSALGTNLLTSDLPAVLRSMDADQIVSPLNSEAQSSVGFSGSQSNFQPMTPPENDPAPNTPDPVRAATDETRESYQVGDPEETHSELVRANGSPETLFVALPGLFEGSPLFEGGTTPVGHLSSASTVATTSIGSSPDVGDSHQGSNTNSPPAEGGGALHPSGGSFSSLSDKGSLQDESDPASLAFLASLQFGSALRHAFPVQSQVEGGFVPRSAPLIQIASLSALSASSEFSESPVVISSSSDGRVGSIYAPESEHAGVSITGPTTLTEGSPSGTYQVVLKTEPTSTVVVRLSAEPGLSLSATSFTFSTGNWSTPQTVSATATTNSTVEGYHGANIWSSTDPSSDLNYDSINGDNFWVGILDANGPNAVQDSAVTDAGSSIAEISVLGNDYQPGGSGLNITGYTQGEAGGTVTLNANQTFAYTPSSGFTGLDHFTYTISNGQGQTTTGDVYVSVASINHTPSLSTISDRTSAEDDIVSYTVDASDPDGDQLYFTATNLPPGLFINTLTGEIYGKVAPYAANPDPNQPVSNSHTYDVTIQAKDSQGVTVTREFDWTINHTNHAPWVVFPGSALDFADSGGTAYHAFLAHDEDYIQGVREIDTLTWSATGLPPNVDIDPWLGEVLGDLTEADVGVWTPTLTVSDGYTTGSITFTWTVLPSGSTLPWAEIRLNDTYLTNDDITNDSAPVSATIVGTPGATVFLRTTGPAVVSQSQVVLGQNGYAQVFVTPTALSLTPGDIRLIAEVVAQVGGGQPQQQQQVQIDEKQLSNIKITLDDVTYDSLQREPYNSLPEGSQNHPIYRTPYKVQRAYFVQLSLDLSKTNHEVKLEAIKKDPQGGSFKFVEVGPNQQLNLVGTTAIKSNGTVTLYGDEMTTPGKHGKLAIKATIGKVTVESKGFSVSAQPTKFRFKNVFTNTTGKEITAKIKDRTGAIVNLPVPAYSSSALYYWDSDSGSLADLDQVWIGEFAIQVEAITNPPWKVEKNMPPNDAYVLPDRGTPLGNRGLFPDRFLVWGNALPAKQASTVNIKQWFGFRDGRAESVDPKDTTHAYQNDFAYWNQERKIYTENQKWYYSMLRTDANGEGEPSDPFVVEIP